jgi:hypothetical protein
MTLPPDDPAHQDFEVQWWGDCANTFSEETKQITYAYRMGLVQTTLGEKWPVYDVGHRVIVDVGGGPSSILLKCLNVGAGSMVIDPGAYPEWTRARYEHCDITVLRAHAERALAAINEESFDEAWCYNVLQHVIDPYEILREARRVAGRIRIFEWVNTEPSLGHPHKLLPEALDEILAGTGRVDDIHENGCHGQAYYGTFLTRPFGPDKVAGSVQTTDRRQ